MSREHDLSEINFDGRTVIVQREDLLDYFANILGLVGLARALLNDDKDNFERIYTLLTGELVTDEAWNNRIIDVLLPSLCEIDIDEQVAANGLMTEFLKNL